MIVTKDEIQQYLSKVHKAVKEDHFRIDRNLKRPDNNRLFEDYLLDDQKAKEIILSLEVEDFSEIKQNKKQGYEFEKLYIFGKEVKLLQRYGDEENVVKLYIKFNKYENDFVVVISFHEQKYPLVYYFK